jgi:hypothetical protein
MTTTISDFFAKTIRIIKADGDTSTTIADLAQFTDFDPALAKTADTATHCIAYDALLAQYKGHEFIRGEADYYDGAWMVFADGSEISFSANSQVIS